ncbi:signal recognition particle receptor subunit beta-like [Papaver somniferum]|uniref:signal recognition particle receptor subunit beta-like n=1 Tax=Papaver somniferum TaxID=3469 RepID=UPI000E70011A|nr:signal recognition particle receptor subunit beta-like [Papaver somniferum]
MEPCNTKRISPIEQIYVAVVVLVLLFAFFLVTSLIKHSKSATMVLAALNGSGRTVPFYQLPDGSAHQGTVASVDPNEGNFVLRSESSKKGKIKPVRVVDVPGHPRLRPKLGKYLPQAAGVIFVIDALDFLPNCRTAAQYLYEILILTNAIVVKKKIPVLIMFNKTDKVNAHTKEFIRKHLENEIDKLRASRNAISAA